MPLVHSRLPSKDEELGQGKRDDDFRPSTRPHSKSGSGGGVGGIWRWRRRRVLLVMVGLVGLWLFVANAPTDVRRGDLRRGGGGERAPVAGGGGDSRGSSGKGGGAGPTGAPPREKDDEQEDMGVHYYSGPIKFYKLASSLHAISSRTFGARAANRNVLFAASSMKSVANLIPMACEMGRWDRNFVHLALFGRDAMALEDILEINGVTKGDCKIEWHDARADYSEYSSDHRLEVSVAGALKHVNDFMHPQAIITDDGEVEDKPFTRAIRVKAKNIGRQVIEVPKGGYEDFLWMTRLDSGSLSSWFKPRIDILIHAPPESSGGLVRLLKSLERAEYAGLRPPRLTVELPSTVEYFTQSYLEDLRWPPVEHRTPMDADTLTLRHRIPSQHISSEQSSLRFVESFYPAKSEDSHVLIVSPQVELSSKYLHYLYYTILEYRYSSYGTENLESLIGVSLDVPSSFLNGSMGFPTPTVQQMTVHRYTDDKALSKADAAPFLYQAPSSSASLIFGDKWLAFHDFLANRITASHTGKASKSKKLVSETEPAWTEYLLELMRARNWNLLVPARSFATVHNELAKLPEEFTREEGAGQKGAEVLRQSDHPEEEAFLTAQAEPPSPVVRDESERFSGSQPLHSTLPFDGVLPELPHLPFLSHAGALVNFTLAEQVKVDFVVSFRQRIGGCEAVQAARKRVVYSRKTGDLFCLLGLEVEFEDDDEEEADGERARAIIDEVGGAKGKAENVTRTKEATAKVAIASTPPAVKAAGL